MPEIHVDPLIAAAAMVATAVIDAIYVMFTHAVVKRKRQDRRASRNAPRRIRA